MATTEPLSWTDARWEVASADPSRVRAIQQQTRLAPVAARCLALRCGDQLPDQAWLRPGLEQLHDPMQMHGMAQAIERIRRAQARGERVRIITDYDVDGTTSSLILQAALALAAPDVRVDYHIPNRFDEGYGFSERAAEAAADDGIHLVVTADIGVRDHQAVRAARARGVDVLICDHHLPAGEQVPEEALVLCPPQQACDYPNPHLAACGVSLKLATALLTEHPRRDALLRSMLKLAAIGTVADLVPLTSAENRAIVRLGLEALNNGPHTPGLDELLRVCGFRGPITESELGFRVGPRINAAGRLVDAQLVVQLLTCRDRTRARVLAKQLDQLNSERRQIQRVVTEAALAQVDADAPDPFVVVSGPEPDGWHRGVVGIVASKLKDALNRPAAVVSVQGDHAVGSVRSLDGIHAVRALDSVADLLVRYGGHPAAAGFTVPTQLLPELRRRLGEYVEANRRPDTFIRRRRVDTDAVTDELDLDLHAQLRTLGPFGMKNPEPRLLLRGVRARDVRAFSDDRHLKFTLDTAQPIGCLWWGEGARAPSLAGRRIDLVGTLGVDTFRGRRSLQLQLLDARDAA